MASCSLFRPSLRKGPTPAAKLETALSSNTLKIKPVDQLPSCAKGQTKKGSPPDPGRNRPKTPDLLRKMSVRTLPGPPGGRGDKNKIKSVLKYSWDYEDMC